MNGRGGMGDGSGRSPQPRKDSGLNLQQELTFMPVCVNCVTPVKLQKARDI